MGASPDESHKGAQGRYASSDDTHTGLGSGPDGGVDIIPWANH